MPSIVETSELSNKKYIQKGLLVLLYFIYLYSLSFVFVPFVSTRIALGILGFSIVFWQIIKDFKKSGNLIISKGWLRIILGLIFLCFASLVSITYNNTDDIQFISYPLSIIMILLGGFLVARTTYLVWRKINFRIVSSYLLGAVVLQVVIALLMFIMPPFRDTMLGLLRTIDIEKSGSLFEFRIIGFGSEFFGSGVVNSCALLLIVVFLRSSSRHVFLLILSYVLIFFVGMMMSRTTLVGAGLSLLYLVYDSRFWILKITSLFVRILCSFFALILVCIGLILCLSTEIKDKMDVGIDYGFEMFVNYFDSGTLSTDSTDELKEFFSIKPQTAKSWVIGDGYFANPNNPSTYYMDTDVGYMRLIFYFGIIGLLIYLILQLLIIHSSYLACQGQYPIFFILCVLLLLIVLSKGFFDFSPLVAVYCFIDNKRFNTV